MGLLSRYLSPSIDPGPADAGRTFSVTLDSPSLSSTSEITLLLLKNSTAGLLAHLFQRRVQARATYSAIFRFYAAPTISGNGTPATPTPRLVGGPAASLLAFTGPTASGNGTLIDVLSTNSYAPSEVNLAPIVLPNTQLVLVTVQASNTGAAVSLEVDWSETTSTPY